MTPDEDDVEALASTGIVVAGVTVIDDPARPAPPLEVPSAVRLTPQAEALREGDRELRWFEDKLRGLRLPPDEFVVLLGVKGRRVGWGVAVRPESLALFGGGSELASLACVEVTEYRVQFAWRVAGKPDLSVLVTFPAAVFNRVDQREAAFVTKVKWVMTELVLARYGLQGYR